MEFEIEFIACTAANLWERSVNPLTGTAVDLSQGMLSIEERESVQALLDVVNASSIGEGDAFAVEFPDGGAATVWFSGFCEGEIRLGAITIERWSLELATWTHQLFRQANLAIAPDDVAASPIVCSNRGANAIAARWPDSLVVGSPQELYKLLPSLAIRPASKRGRGGNCGDVSGERKREPPAVL